MHKRWYRAEAEWDPVSEWPGSERLWEREAAMMAYVTFRMTLPGHTGPLPHQFYCCSRGHHITQSHTHTGTATASGNVALPGRTHPEPLIGCWKPAALPLLPSRQDSAWKQSDCATTTGHCCSAAQRCSDPRSGSLSLWQHIRVL